MGKRKRNHMSYDVLEDILLRLPIRSLVRFKAVSKDIRALISSTNFIAAHHKNSKTNPSSVIRSTITYFDSRSNRFFINKNGTAVLQTIDPGWYHQVVRLVGCANGLVCVELAFCGSSRRTFTLWNPATKQYKHVCYPTWSPDNCAIVGFGYHSGIKDYKLFGMAQLQTQAQVFSLRHCTSREIDTGVLVMERNDMYGPGVVIKGVWYGALDTDGGPRILSFDLKDDSFAVIDFPLTTDVIIRGVELGVRDDQKLCLYAVGFPSNQCHGWTLTGEGVSSSWARMFASDYRIPYPTPLRIRPRLLEKPSFVFGQASLKPTFTLLLWDYYNPEYYLDVIKGNFLWDLLTPKSEKIAKTMEGLYLDVHEAYDLVESLVSPFLLEL